jgi:AraC-like DNA-binding protein
MRQFYNKALISFIGLLLISFLIGYLCASRTFLQMSLLPVEKNPLPWRIVTRSDAEEGGSSSFIIRDDKFSLNFDFLMTSSVQYPFITHSLTFIDSQSNPKHVDLSGFDSLSFSVKCLPSNILTFALVTFDEKVTRSDDPVSYRSPTTYFSCNENWAQVELDLTRLETPQWWFDLYKMRISDKAYTLDKVQSVNFGSSWQSQMNQLSNVQIADIRLSGHKWKYAYWGAAGLLVIWLLYIIWIFKLYTRSLIRELQEKLQRDRPLVAYQQLSLEPHRDKDKSAILRFMATEYANPELSVDAMVSSIGVSRTKINEILKTELGYTFTAYLNKLRLTEAARLLAEKEEANVAEIAYTVGYKNVSYFNKLFKEEYSCTPKAFKGLYDSKEE